MKKQTNKIVLRSVEETDIANISGLVCIEPFKEQDIKVPEKDTALYELLKGVLSNKHNEKFLSSLGMFYFDTGTMKFYTIKNTLEKFVNGTNADERLCDIYNQCRKFKSFYTCQTQNDLTPLGLTCENVVELLNAGKDRSVEFANIPGKRFSIVKMEGIYTVDLHTVQVFTITIEDEETATPVEDTKQETHAEDAQTGIEQYISALEELRRSLLDKKTSEEKYDIAFMNVRSIDIQNILTDLYGNRAKRFFAQEENSEIGRYKDNIKILVDKIIGNNLHPISVLKIFRYDADNYKWTQIDDFLKSMQESKSEPLRLTSIKILDNICSEADEGKIIAVVGILDSRKECNDRFNAKAIEYILNAGKYSQIDIIPNEQCDKSETIFITDVLHDKGDFKKVVNFKSVEKSDKDETANKIIKEISRISSDIINKLSKNSKS